MRPEAHDQHYHRCYFQRGTPCDWVLLYPLCLSAEDPTYNEPRSGNGLVAHLYSCWVCDGPFPSLKLTLLIVAATL